MKKTLIASLIALTTGLAFAGNYFSVDVDSVKDSVTKAKNTAQYIRVGKDIGTVNFDLQVRTAVLEKGGMLNSLEATAGKNLGHINVFAGLGHDNGFNGARNGSYEYGLVGASTGIAFGPVYTYAGAKTRVNWETSAPKQTVVFAGASYPLTKTVSANAGWSKSLQNIKEDALGLGIRVNF